ncbi:MAG: DedA family protein [Fibrobacter sp.]|jgi:membrane protein DedA with SNARE-associated domain|nr:DedA family protein [Fibrobacter sp.]
MIKYLLPVLLFGFSFAAASDGSVYTSVINWYNDHLNYGTITLLMAVESSFIPFPSELVVPPAAYKALQPESGLNIIFVVLFATVGAIIGALINYYLAKYLGRPIIYRFAESRLGRLCLLSEDKVKQAEQFFLKNGSISTLVGRLIPGIRQLISIPAGLAEMKMLPFLVFTTIGATLWNIILAIVGYFAHGQKDLIEKYSGELSVALLGLCVLFVAYLIFSALRSKKKTEE